MNPPGSGLWKLLALCVDREMVLHYSSSLMTQILNIDIEAGGLLGPSEPVVTVSQETYRLTYLDPAFDRAGASHQAASRTKEFEHLGAAIAWARRSLFRREVSGDHIELQVLIDGVESEAFDIRLSGIARWQDNDYRQKGPMLPIGKDYELYIAPEAKRCRPRSRYL